MGADAQKKEADDKFGRGRNDNVEQRADPAPQNSVHTGLGRDVDDMLADAVVGAGQTGSRVDTIEELMKREEGALKEIPGA